MPIFRYTLKKMLLTPSTWVVIVLSVLFITLASALPLISFDINNSTAEEIITQYLNIWKPMMFFVFLGLMLFIFIAIKATQVFRDEIDDGTLLILVSKPVSRTKIWIEKLFALQIIILLFMFLSIFVSGIFIAIPGIGSGDIYSKMFPYMCILFGVGIIFDLIVSSIAVLLSLVLNGKAIVAIMVSFAGLFFISSLIMQVFTPTNKYMEASQAAAVYSTVKNKLNTSDLAWLDAYIANKSTIKNQIDTDLKAIYSEYKPGFNYPDEYDYKFEQDYVTKIAKDEIVPPTGANIDVDLTKHILAVASIFRQWSQQSFRELLTGERAGFSYNSGGDNKNFVNYSVKEMIDGLNLTISQEEYEKSNKQLSQTKTLRYLNIFYHLQYIWNGISTPAERFVNISDYKQNSDPYLVSWKKVPGTDTYQVDTSEKVDSKIINFAADLTAYLVIGLILFGSSWFVFNRKDFA